MIVVDIIYRSKNLMPKNLILGITFTILAIVKSSIMNNDVADFFANILNNAFGDCS